MMYHNPNNTSDDINEQNQKIRIVARIFTCFGLLFLSLFLLAMGHEILKSLYKPCNVIERFEPCEFENKISLPEVKELIGKMRDLQMKIEKVEYVIAQNLSNESITKLLNSTNSHKSDIQKLKEEFEYQKLHRGKCFFDNHQIEQNNITKAARIFDICYLVVLIALYSALIYNLLKLNFKKVDKEQRGILLLSCIVIFFANLWTIKIMIFNDFLFPPKVSKEILENLPIYVKEFYDKNGGGWNCRCILFCSS